MVTTGVISSEAGLGAEVDKQPGLLGTFWHEIGYMSPTEKAKALGTIGAFCGMQAAGAAQGPAVLAMSLPFRYLGHDPFLDVSGSAALAGAWCSADASISYSLVNRVPKTAEAFTRTWLGRACNKALVGLEPAPPELINFEDQKNFVSRHLSSGNLLLNYSRAITMQGVGTAPYMIKAAQQNQSRLERLRLRDNLGRAGALFWGSVMGITTVGANLAINQDPGLAGQIMNYLKEPGIWLGLTLAISTRNIPLKRMANEGIHRAAALMRWQRSNESAPMLSAE